MNSETTFTLWRLLREQGPSEFGLMAQVFLAICFKQFGAEIRALKQTGHPDIEFFYQDKLWRIETEFIAPLKDSYDIKQEDLDATISESPVDTGYISLLNCNFPARWILVNTEVLLIEGIRKISTSRLQSICNTELSGACSSWSNQFISENKNMLLNMKYSSLRDHFLLEE